VGAGLAGLVAAHRVLALGGQPTVFESSARAGGFIETIRRDGWLVEAGPGIVADLPSELSPLLSTIGVVSEMVHPMAAPRQFLVHGNSLVQVPSSTGDIIATPLLSVPGRLRMLREPFVARMINTEETVADFASRRFGTEFARNFLEPLVAASTGGDPARLIAAEALPKLTEFERRAGSVLKGRMRARRDALRENTVVGQPWSCRLGMGYLAERLATSLADRLVCNQPVGAITIDETSVRITADTEHEFDAVVIALPPPAMAQLDVSDSLRLAIAAIGGIPCASAVSVSLGYRRDQVSHSLDGAVVFAPSDAKASFLAMRFPSSAFAERTPEGHVLISLMAGGVMRPLLNTMNDRDLVAQLHAEASALLGIRAEPVFSSVTRWTERLPQAVAGHAARRAAVESTEAQLGRVTFCGAWRDGLAVSEAMMGGWRAAERVMQATHARC
jgi:oxygen-dependent protoporphyrinogen oxidase